jgi:hypothetical protein
MGFDAAKFEAAQFVPRTEEISVPALAHFFSEGEPAVWRVRGLNTNQLHQAMEAGKRQTTIESIVAAITKSGDMAQAVRSALGLSHGTPGEVAKRLEMLVMGSVSPEVTLPVAVKLAEAFPVEFLELTNAITTLTGQGFDMGKPQAASPQTAD